MTVGMAVRERILQLCRERGITVNKLAVLSGVTQSTLNNIVGGRNHSTTVSTLQKVCDALRTGTPCVEVDEATREAASAPLLRMLALSK